MSNLTIEVVKNGFIVYENAQMGMVRRTWVFNTPSALGDHIAEWGTVTQQQLLQEFESTKEVKEKQ